MSDFIKSVEDLKVFQKSYAVSIDIHKVTMGFPKIEQYGGMGDQMRRASKSVCVNLAEGFAKQRGSSMEFKRFLLIAIGSSDEMQIWLNYCRDLDYLSKDQAEKWKAEYKEIAKMLNGLKQKWN